MPDWASPNIDMAMDGHITTTQGHQTPTNISVEQHSINSDAMAFCNLVDGETLTSEQIFADLPLIVSRFCECFPVGSSPVNNALYRLIPFDGVSFNEPVPPFDGRVCRYPIAAVTATPLPPTMQDELPMQGFSSPPTPASSKEFRLDPVVQDGNETPTHLATMDWEQHASPSAKLALDFNMSCSPPTGSNGIGSAMCERTQYWRTPSRIVTPPSSSTQSSPDNPSKSGVEPESMVYFGLGRLQTLDLSDIAPVYEELFCDLPNLEFPSRDDIDAILMDKPTCHDSEHVSWAGRMRNLTGLCGGDWAGWAKWADTPFMVVAGLNEEGKSNGIYIVAKPYDDDDDGDDGGDDGDDDAGCDGRDHHAHGGCGSSDNAGGHTDGDGGVETGYKATLRADNMGAAMPQYQGGKKAFVWARIGDRFSDMGYETELVLKHGHVVTGPVEFCWAGVKKGDSVARPIAY